MNINPSKTIHELLCALAFALDIEDNKKIYHNWRVAILSNRLANNLPLKAKKEIFYASLLHDVGGIGFPYHIIHYLTKKNYPPEPILLSHPLISTQLVSIIPQMTQAAKLILDHHEWFNGYGYPRGKHGNKIPYGAQLIRMADAVDILLQNKYYRKPNNLIKKLTEIKDKECSEKIADSAIRILNDHKFFKEIANRRNIPNLFEKVKNKIGPPPIKIGIDAIGTTLEVIAQIIDMKHLYTWGHSIRVSRYSISIALAMDMDHDEITKIRWAGLIHDIGKLTVPRKILDKPSSLTRQEFAEIKRHPKISFEILNMIPVLKDVASIAHCHHEHYDGKGYPYGLKQDQIPLGARILAVCDAFDAMTSYRPYRRNFETEIACQEIERLSGKQFDPQVVREAIPLFKNLTI